VAEGGEEQDREEDQVSVHVCREPEGAKEEDEEHDEAEGEEEHAEGEEDEEGQAGHDEVDGAADDCVNTECERGESCAKARIASNLPCTSAVASATSHAPRSCAPSSPTPLSCNPRAIPASPPPFFQLLCCGLFFCENSLRRRHASRRSAPPSHSEEPTKLNHDSTVVPVASDVQVGLGPEEGRDATVMEVEGRS